MRSFRIPVLLLAAAIIAVSACGNEKDGGKSPAPQVYKKEESITLRKEGTAESPEEAARRTVEDEAQKASAKVRDTIERRVVPALKKAKDNSDRLIDAIGEFSKLGEAAAPWKDTLDPYLAHADEEVRAVALEALTAVAKMEALPAIEKGLRDEGNRVRITSLRLLRDLNVDSIKPAIEFLKESDAKLQYSAMEYLAGHKDNVDVQLGVERSLTELDGPAAKLALRFLLDVRDKIPSLGAKVLELFDHRDPSLRTEAVRALGKLGKRSEAAARKLAVLLRDDPEETVVKESLMLLQAWAGGGAPGFDLEGDDAKRYEQGAEWLAWIDKNAARFRN